MGEGPYRSKDVIFPAFDPTPSIERGRSLLDTAGVPYALAGRLAVWACVPADDHELTKDVDFAVPEDRMAELEAVVKAEGLETQPLSIGGFAVRDEDIRIDFIDRRVDFGALFSDAVEAAHAQGTVVRSRQGVEIPVVPPEFIVAMKLATGDPRDERDVERVLARNPIPYETVRAVVRQYLGPGVANRLDYIGARIGQQEAARYVRTYNGKA